jgi:hypothetical protein
MEKLANFIRQKFICEVMAKMKEIQQQNGLATPKIL